MFGSNVTLFVQFGGSTCAIGESGIGYSPPTESDCVLERYGQKFTLSEFSTVPGQFASATGVPFTGFSGTGGFGVVPGLATFDQTAGPGVGSVTVPVRRPHQLFFATTGVVELFVVPSAFTLRTPNALSVMLLASIVEAWASTRRTAAASRRFWFPSAWLPTAYVVVPLFVLHAGAGEVIEAI